MSTPLADSYWEAIRKHNEGAKEFTEARYADAPCVLWPEAANYYYHMRIAEVRRCRVVYDEGLIHCLTHPSDANDRKVVLSLLAVLGMYVGAICMMS